MIQLMEPVLVVARSCKKRWEEWGCKGGGGGKKARGCWALSFEYACAKPHWYLLHSYAPIATTTNSPMPHHHYQMPRLHLVPFFLSLLLAPHQQQQHLLLFFCVQKESRQALAVRRLSPPPRRNLGLQLRLGHQEAIQHATRKTTRQRRRHLHLHLHLQHHLLRATHPADAPPNLQQVHELHLPKATLLFLHCGLVLLQLL